MTRYRVPFSGLTILAVAVSAALDVNAQAKSTASARILNSSGGVLNSCTGYSLTIGAGGDLDVKCDTAATPTPTPSPTPTPTPAPTTPTPSEITSPAPGSTITGGSATFTWNTGYGLEARYLVIRSGGKEYYSNYPAGHNVAGLSQTVTGLPTSGTIAVELSSYFGATTGWATKYYSYTAAAGNPTPSPSPSPSPSPTPTPSASCVNSAGQTIPAPANMVMQNMYIGGTNNYVFDSLNFVNPVPPADGSQASPDPRASGPEGTVQVFTLPQAWPDGTPVTLAKVAFVSYIYYNLSGAQYEVAFSRCKGDFEYYKTSTAKTSFLPGGDAIYSPCGIVWGTDFPIKFGAEAAYNVCKVTPGETWYMNWRVLSCPSGAGRTCGQTFYVPKG